MQNKLSRRRFLEQFSRFLALLFPINAFANEENNSAGGKVGFSLLSAMVDTIVPTDETPGALEAGVAEQLKQEISSGRYLSRSVAQLAAESERRSMSVYLNSFSDLSVDQRENIFSLIEVDPNLDASVKYAFRYIRRTVLDKYYVSETGQLSVNYLPPFPRENL